MYEDIEFDHVSIVSGGERCVRRNPYGVCMETKVVTGAVNFYKKGKCVHSDRPGNGTAAVAVAIKTNASYTVYDAFGETRPH